MMTPTEQYKYDNKFRQIVDILRHELMCYEYTPSELRQAVILAATMHAEQNIRPTIYIDEAKLIPSMFGGLIGKFDVQGCTSGRIDSSKPNFTEQVKEGRIGVVDRRVYSDPFINPRNKWERYQHEYAELGRNRETGDRRKATKHIHKFEYIHNRDYYVCSCGISNVYYDSTLEPKTATGSNL